VLLDLDDLASDEPVRVDHRRVDRARDARAIHTVPIDAAGVEVIMVGMSMLGGDTSVVDRLANNIGSRRPVGRGAQVIR